MEKILVYWAIKYKGDWKKILEALQNKEKVDPLEVEKTVSKVSSKWITLLSDEYPEYLKRIYAPPLVLFYKGDISLLKKESVAVIGSREASEYGLSMCEQIAKEITKAGYQIISGLAVGIDREAHKSCINNDGKTIAVLGYGIDYEMEEVHKDIITNGVIISEYPFKTPPSKDKFLFRNRLISALSRAVVVIEAKRRSGTMNTVSYALDQGKEIFAVPTRANEESGCNLLIKEGAKLVETGKDVLEEL